MWRLIYAPISWLLFFILLLALILLGHIFVPILLALGAYEKKYSVRLQRYYLGFPALFYLWSNEEDGVLGSKEYQERYPKWSEFRRGWMWSAIRNPVNNLRFVPLLSCKISPERIGFQGSISKVVSPQVYDNKSETYWYFCWHGFYSCYRRQYRDSENKLNEFWIGWKLWPSDSFGLDESLRRHGAGFACQWREYTSIGGTPYG